MTTQEIIDLEKKVLLGTYLRPSFVISHGNGVYLFDTEGKRYLDFVAGIAVNAFGYGDEGALAALHNQAAKVWHCSNLYYSESQVRLAEQLVNLTFAEKIFFTNSGTEAIEGIIKIARKWARHTKGQNSFEIIVMNQSFHGRSMGSLSATGQKKFWQDFEPMLPGFKFADFNDLESVKALISDDTCAILVEPIQGEGGIYPADRSFLQGLRNIADKNNCLLILDEIQCGVSRTGRFCAHECYDIQPDMMAIAKPLAGGMPLGAILMTDQVAQFVNAGNHGSTFGGGPLACAVANYVVKRVNEPEFLAHVEKMGHYLHNRLSELKDKNNSIDQVRGIGLMLGVELKTDVKPVIDACIKEGLLICKAGDNTIRFLPPLVVQKEHIEEAIAIFLSALERGNYDT